ncbi:AbfB domain-containing protein [Streptomyces sp. NPDC007971]|uniref:AbfB domain-containing protein n=1 Tax=Streptomyces sp. NPDC007971 TaxID=3364799 RepID=UPI0036E23A5A
MPDNTPRPPQRRPWEADWEPDSARASGARRLLLAGALALTAVTACITGLAVNDGTPEPKAARPASTAPADDGPGLLSFASPPARTTGPPRSTGAMTPTPVAPQAASAPTATPKHAPAAPPERQASSPGPTPKAVSVRSLNYPDRYWHIVGDQVNLDPVPSPSDRRAATFRLVEGLFDARCYSFATAGGGYLRHRGFLLRAEHSDGSSLFRQDATFCPRTSSFTGATMLESLNYPGRFLRHQNFRLKLDPAQNSDLYRADSAFLLVDAVA